jgi:hypothetical protein
VKGKLATILKGLDNVRVVELHFPNKAILKIELRPITALVETEILHAARTFAQTRGVTDPTDENPIYAMGVWVHTLRAGCFSTDEEDRGAPLFESIEDVMLLDKDRICYLFEQQQILQEEIGFRKERLSFEQMVDATIGIARAEVGDSHLPFWRWGPTLRASYMHFLANLSLDSLTSKSLHTAASAWSTSGSGKPLPETPQNKDPLRA